MNQFLTQLAICVLLLAVCARAPAAEWTYVEDVSGNPQGGVIIRYPDLAELHARDLSHQLSHHGWSSVLVPVTPTTEARGLTDTLETIDYMKSKKGKFNLVLVSFGATWDDTLDLQDVTNEDGDIERPIQAVVLVDVPGEFFPADNIPTLDLTTTLRPVPGWERRQDIARRDDIDKNQGVTLRYSTRRKPRTEFQKDRESFLTRRIRGWLFKHARGMKLNQTST